VHGLIADGAGGAWTFGGSILTFAFPMILFVIVAGGLYVLYTKPESVPGHSAPGLQRSVSYTAVPGRPAVRPEAQSQPAFEAARVRPAAAGTAGIITGATPETDATAETPAAETPAAETPAPASTAEPPPVGTAPASTAEPAAASTAPASTAEPAPADVGETATTEDAE
jgi:hypothetical protein